PLERHVGRHVTLRTADRGGELFARLRDREHGRTVALLGTDGHVPFARDVGRLGHDEHRHHQRNGENRNSDLHTVLSAQQSTRITSERVMMKFLSVLKSRTSTAGFCGVIIVESSSTGVEMSTNGKAG